MVAKQLLVMASVRGVKLVVVLRTGVVGGGYVTAPSVEPPVSGDSIE